MKKKVIKILNIVVDIIVVMILIMSVFVLAVSLTSNSNGGVPNVFGKAPMRVLSDSMEPTFSKHDLIFSDKVVDPMAEIAVVADTAAERHMDIKVFCLIHHQATALP